MQLKKILKISIVIDKGSWEFNILLKILMKKQYIKKMWPNKEKKISFNNACLILIKMYNQID